MRLLNIIKDKFSYYANKDPEALYYVIIGIIFIYLITAAILYRNNYEYIAYIMYSPLFIFVVYKIITSLIKLLK